MQCVPADFSAMHDGHIMVTTAMFGAIVVCILFVIMGTSLAKDIRPFKRAETGTPEEYFSTHLEGVRKDVECTFGILKKRWRILNNGFFHRDMVICEKIFITCCWLNNFMLDVMERTNVRVGRGAPIGVDGIWLSGTTVGRIHSGCSRCQNLSLFHVSVDQAQRLGRCF